MYLDFIDTIEYECGHVILSNTLRHVVHRMDNVEAVRATPMELEKVQCETELLMSSTWIQLLNWTDFRSGSTPIPPSSLSLLIILIGRVECVELNPSTSSIEAPFRRSS